MGMWDDEEENTEFRDIPDETQLDEGGQMRSAPPAQVQRTVQPQVPAPRQQPQAPAPAKIDREDEEFLETLLEDQEEDFSEVLNDANLRIEQGRLYQMIMNHDLFEGMDADPRAVQNVQREIRKFARESMEVMLGMRQTTPVHAQAPSPFNELEVQVLKMVASKASNGATESPEANKVAEAIQQVPKKKTFTPISGSTGTKRSTPAPQRAPAPQQAAPKKPLQTRAQTPVTRTKNDEIIDQILAEEGVSRADLELEYTGIGKKLHELTSEELEQRKKATAARLASRRSVKSESAIPMATPEQQELLALQRATAMKGSEKMDGLKIPGGMSALLDKVKSMPIKNPG